MTAKQQWMPAYFTRMCHLSSERRSLSKLRKVKGKWQCKQVCANCKNK